MEKNSNTQKKIDKNDVSISEHAINKKEVDGRDINQQQIDKGNIHQPRDNA